MKVAFEEINEQARVWIYQAEKPLSATQKQLIEEALDNFTTSWDSHGAPLQASYKILENQFIVLTVDEGFNAASGCSIDKSVAIFKKLENLTGLSLLEKSRVAYQNKEVINFVDFRAIKEKVAAGEITPTTKVFDITITTMDQFKDKWPLEAKETWLNRFLA